jgi:Ca2+-binding RTX toxin-like protein
MHPLVLEAKRLAESQLKQFAHRSDFLGQLAIAFGPSFNCLVAQRLQSSWQRGDFSTIPPIEVLPRDILNNAAAAYAQTIDKIYLSQHFLTQKVNDISAIVGVLLEEIGHHLDTLLNLIETPGDEGAIFSRIVLGNLPTTTELQQLRAENDWSLICLKGQFIAVEQAVITGTSGNDYSLFGTSDPDTIQGLGGLDYLSGLGGDDFLDGGNGNDILEGGLGNDTLLGGAGDDTLIDAGAGVESIIGGAGNDLLQIDSSDSTVNLSVSYTTSTNGSIVGGNKNGSFFREVESIHFTSGSGSDIINVSAAVFDSVVYGGDGNDLITTGNGADIIDGGFGSDTLIGNNGNDTFYEGGAGVDSIVGGSGNDYLQLDIATETTNLTIAYTSLSNGSLVGGVKNGTTFSSIETIEIFSGIGNDTINVSAANLITIDNYSTLILCGAGNDLITTGNGDDFIDGELGDDTLLGGAGNDAFYEGGIGLDSIDGAAGNDYLQLDLSTDTTDTTITYIAVSDGIVVGGIKNGTSFRDIENIEILSGSGNDTVNVTAANVSTTDYYAGSIFTGMGNDSITSGAGNDYIDGGTGNDTLIFGTASNTINLSLTAIQNTDEGSDIIRSIENITAGDGDDTLIGSSASNQLNGENGNDSLSGDNGNDTLWGGQGNDVLRGDSGADTAVFGNANNSVDLNISLQETGEGLDTLIGIENILGGNGNDTLTGSSGNNLLNGNLGNDVLNGGLGGDTLLGGEGNDLIFEVGAGVDSIGGGNGNDLLSIDNSFETTSVTLTCANVSGSIVGGSKDGTAFQGIESIIFFAGSGNNTLDARAEVASTILGGAGNDIILTSSGSDSLAGGAGDDTLISGEGNDTLFEIGVGVGIDSIDGGGGNDFLSIDNATEIVSTTINYSNATGSILGGGKSGTAFQNIELISLLSGSGEDSIFIGSALLSTIVGGGGNDSITAGAGSDSLLGDAGNDSLSSAAGNDTLSGGNGNDNLNGGQGADLLTGGLGNDIYSVDNLGDVVSELLNSGTDTVNSSISYSLGDNIENLTLTGTANRNSIGNELNNNLVGNSGNNNLNGGEGNDSLLGGNGNDTLNGNNGTDTAIFGAANNTVDLNLSTTQATAEGSDLLISIENLSGGSGNDTLTGNTINNLIDGGDGDDSVTGDLGEDTLIGSAGNDKLVDGTGNDSLLGGTGKDSLTGGVDFDTFTFTALNHSLLASFDVITDYSSGEQIDAPSTITAATLTSSAGNATSLSGTAISSILTSGVFSANSVRAFTVTGNDGIYIAFNNGTAGFNAATDSIIYLQGYSLGSVVIS